MAVIDEEDAGLAAEYVLHLLPEDERRAAEDRLAIDGGFRARVADWTEHLSRLTDDVAPVTPPPGIRARLEAAVGAAAEPERGATPRRGGLRWFGGAVGMAFGAVAAIVILIAVLPPVQPPYSGPFYAAELAGQQSDLVVQARFDPRDDTLLVERQSGAAAAGRVLQLWLIAGDADPVSLGVLPEDTTARIEVPAPLGQQIAGGILAISDEPPGGSPTGLPTGDVLAAGEVGEV